MTTPLEQINADIAELSTRIDRATGHAQADARPTLQALRDQAARLHHLIGTTRLATESTWEGMKADVTVGYAHLEASIREARTWLSTTIAP
jgi:hypothetical protein